MIKHIVLWTLKNELNGRSKKELALEMKSHLEALKNEIQVINKLEVGINHADAPPSNYDICLMIDFETIDDLQQYQIHPAHLAFKDYVITVRDEKAAIDFKYP
ncbi:MAG: Dabb family protein [Bacteroidetes bacterium]|nr:Dabb family protein [Bacteroidota bacterium]MBL6963712.1 Dabb family protein [Bacteroidota bacterium]